jgi:hypothetical protein
MKKLFTLYVITILLVLFTSTVVGQDVSVMPTLINYQGFLTNQNGTTLNGSYQITFALYSEPTGAASIVWDETHDAINIENGLFNVLLGSIDTITVDDLDGVKDILGSGYWESRR